MKQPEYFLVEDEKKETNENEKSIVHFITTPDIDRGRDIVNPKGMDSADFEKTKTVFYNHNYYSPIGKNLWIKTINDGVRVKTQFASTDFAQEIYQLHKENVINTWSIGFDVPRRSGRYSEPIDGAIEFDDKRGIRTINKWILLEYSSAPLAMNPNALDVAKSFVKSAELRKEIETIEATSDVKELLNAYKKDIDDLKTLIGELKTGNEFEKINNEITEIKNNLSKKSVESLEKKPSLSEYDYARLFLRELSKITGKKFKI